FHCRVHQHDYGLRALHNPLFWRLEFSVSRNRFLEVHSFLAKRNPDSLRTLGNLRRHQVRDNFRSHHSSRIGYCDRRDWCSLVTTYPCRLRSDAERLHPGALLAAGQNLFLPFLLRLGARNSSPLSLRPAHEHRVEASSSRFYRERDRNGGFCSVEG